MAEMIILRRSGNPVRMSFLSAVLGAEGIEASVQNFPTGVWRLVVRADQAEAAQSVLHSLRADPAP